MKTRILALALCLSLLLTGCEAMLHGEYLTVEPHSMLSAAEDDSSVIRVENYQELVSGILRLSGAGRHPAQQLQHPGCGGRPDRRLSGGEP